MKGNDRVLTTLNKLLADELTAINQYIVHSEMCDNWGYDKLHDKTEKRAIDEMKHAEKLIARVIFLEGTPIVERLNPMHIGKDVELQLKNDLTGEMEACKVYNAAIKECEQYSDNGSRELLESILKDEEAHVDWLEAQLDQVSQMGIQIYLSQQKS